MKFKRKKKGLTSLETCIGSLIFIVVFAVLCDFIILSHRYLSLTDSTKEMARILSVQGGALSEKPASFKANYYTIDQLGVIFKRQMNKMGFKDGEFRMDIYYTDIYDDALSQKKTINQTKCIMGILPDGKFGVTGPTEKIEYLSDFSVIISATYDWPFMGAVFRNKKSYLRVSMPGLSEWKYNYDGWSSETGV